MLYIYFRNVPQGEISVLHSRVGRLESQMAIQASQLDQVSYKLPL